MNPIITAFEDSPDGGVGLARDMRVRWALEEAGQAYDVRLVSMTALKEAGHLAISPFGSIPTYEDGELKLFESGAIVLHIAQQHAALMPTEAGAAKRAVSWMFAALNTLEPPIVEREMARMAGDAAWAIAHADDIDDRIRSRLARLSNHLGDRRWLDETFSAGDLLTIDVLRRLEGELVNKYANLSAYVARGESRPAFRRAFAAQRQVFTASQQRSAARSA